MHHLGRVLRSFRTITFQSRLDCHKRDGGREKSCECVCDGLAAGIQCLLLYSNCPLVGAGENRETLLLCWRRAAALVSAARPALHHAW